MDYIEAIILGLLQGLSEFIPISSTAHLTVAGKLFGLINPDSPEKWTAFIAVIQLGTLVAVLVYFSKELKRVPEAFLKENVGKNAVKFRRQSQDSKMGWLIIVGTIPIVIIGLAFKDFIQGAFTKNLTVIASSLIVLALILALAEKTGKFRKSIDKIGVWDALIIGFAQCLALIPGSSRSGTTITAGLFLGVKREAAARFSFLLSVPAVFASGVLEFYLSLEYLTMDQFGKIIVSTAVAAVSGYFAIDFLLKFLKSRTTAAFIIYRIALGLLILLFIYFNIIE